MMGVGFGFIGLSLLGLAAFPVMDNETQSWRSFPRWILVLWALFFTTANSLFMLLSIGLIAYSMWYKKTGGKKRVSVIGPPKFADNEWAHAASSNNKTATWTPGATHTQTVAAPTGPVDYSFELARSLGWLSNRGSASSLPYDTPVMMDADLAEKGVLVIGPSGSGKTFSVLQPFIFHWLKAPTYGLFGFGVKPNWTDLMRRSALHSGRKAETIHIVGPKGEPFPLMYDLSPDAMGNFIREAASTGSQGGSNFFVDSASLLGREICTILFCSTKKSGPFVRENGDILRYDLRSLAMIGAMNAETFAPLNKELLERSEELIAAGEASYAKRLLDSCAYVTNFLAGKADAQREGIVASFNTVLASFFTDEDFVNAFSGDPEAVDNFRLGEALDRGDVCLLNCDLSQYPLGSRLVYLLAFENLQAYMRSRLLRPKSQRNPIAFIADEYAEISSEKHNSLFRICREAAVCPIVAYQIHSDLAGKIGKDKADGMVRNFGTTIMFATSDTPSIDLVRVGQTEQEFVSESVSQGSSASSGLTLAQMASGGTNSGTSVSKSLQQRAVVDEQLIEQMENHLNLPVKPWAHCLVRTYQKGKRAMDVCTVRGYVVPEFEQTADGEWVEVVA